MLAINQILQGRYRIIRQLGHGGMGAVYEAIDERFGEPIALKEIIIDSVSEKQREMISKAFEREAKSLAKAKHEAVPFVRDYFFELSRQFLVMELVEGEDLGEMLERRGSPFPLEEVLNWMDQLLDALDYLHNLKPAIIHRDIKPQNLKLSVRRRIKLLDFGIARSSDKSSATITRQTFVGATLNYSPIEQILRVIDQTFREFIILKHQAKAEAVLSQDTDARCDIYALGGTFYHLLTNQVPIEATKRTLDIWEGKSDPLPNPSALNPHLPLPISNCLLKAMAIEQDQRYSSALEMQLALKGAIAEMRARTADHERITQAETIKISTNENLRVEGTGDLSPVDSVSAHSVEIPSAATNLSLAEFALKESSGSGFSETKPSGHLSNPEFTAPSYLIGEVPHQKKTAPEIPLPVIPKAVEPVSTSNRKIFWAIPIVLIAFLGVSGLGGAVWFMLPPAAPPISNKSVVNPVNPTPTITALPTNPVTPTASPTNSPLTTTTSTPVEGKTEMTKPVVVATPKTPVPVRSKTPVIRKTPKPQQDPNCVFTNSCK